MQYNKIGAVLSHNAREHGHSKTPQQYSDICKRFGAWVKEQNGSERVSPDSYKEWGQRWLDTLQGDGKSAASLKTYRAAISAGIGCKNTEFKIPSVGAPTKGRGSIGKITDKNRAIVDLARDTGIRRAEIAHLTGGDFVKTKDGHYYIHVESGKGGKEQYQLILPNHVQNVQNALQGVAKDEKVFSPEQMKKSAKNGLHECRRQYAREAYNYFKNLPEPEKNYYRHEMQRRFEANPAKHRAWDKYQERLKASPEYYTRGINHDRLMEQGLPTHYDREAVMMASVFCLSHYREDVTVTNYLIP